MPFVYLVNNHDCPLPKTRDDGSALVVGDRWVCDAIVDGTVCYRRWQWACDQREGNFWRKITREH